MKMQSVVPFSLRIKKSSSFLILIICILANIKTIAQVNVNDSLALVSIYNTTNGPNWYHHDNWLTGPVSSWYGINTFNTRRVILIDLSNNNLSGYLSMDFSGLDSLTNLFLINNNLTGSIPNNISTFLRLNGLALSRNHLTSPITLSLGSLPNLYYIVISDNDFTGTFPDTLLKNSGLGYLYNIDSNNFDNLPFINSYNGVILCRNNNLTFEDILPYSQGSSISSFFYYPQDSIGNLLDTTSVVGDNLTLDSWCSGIGNSYRWKKGSLYITPADTISTLTFNNIQLNQAGYYTCEVKNSGAPLLTLYRKRIHLYVNLQDAIESIPDPSEPLISFNPENNFLRLGFRFTKGTSIKSNLYDMMGRKVMTLYDGRTSYQDLHYYLSWLKPGIYIVTLQFDGKQKCFKILIN